MRLWWIKIQLGNGLKKNNSSTNLFEENILTVPSVSKRKINRRLQTKIIRKRGRKLKKKL